MASKALALSGKKSVLVPSSSEEEDLITRSSKKIKNGYTAKGEKLLSEQWPALGETKTASHRGAVSFADKLKGVEANENDSSDEDIEEISDESLSDKEQHQQNDEPLCRLIEDPKRNFPTFVFSEKMKKKLYRAWKTAVIVKLLGRNIGFKALEARLQSMWAKKGVIKLINIGHGYYAVKLSNREDYWNALTGGPWMIYDHYLTVRPWEPQFQSNRAIIDKVAVWVRLPRIFLEYYDEKALTTIGNRIGETMKIDINTSCQLRGHYARICVLVDLTKQLMSGFYMDDENYFLEYEGLHLLCTNCGVYGHQQDECPLKKNNKEAQGDDMNALVTVDDEQKMNVDDSENPTEDQWRVVQKLRRQRKNRDKPGEASRQNLMGSRFSLLADVEGGNQERDNGKALEEQQMSIVPALQNTTMSTTRVRKAKDRKNALVNMTNDEIWSAINRVPIENIPQQPEQSSIKRRSEKRTREQKEQNKKGKEDEEMVPAGNENFSANHGNKNEVGPNENIGLVNPINQNNIPSLPHDPGDKNMMDFDTSHIGFGPILNSPMYVEAETSRNNEETMIPETKVLLGFSYLFLFTVFLWIVSFIGTLVGCDLFLFTVFLWIVSFIGTLGGLVVKVSSEI